MSINIPKMIAQSGQIILQPRTSTFKRIARESKPSVAAAFLYMLLSSIIISVIIFYGGMILFAGAELGAVFGYGIIIAVIVTFIFYSILHLVLSIFLHFITRLFGSSGTIKQLTYNFSIFWVPFVTLAFLLSLYGLVTSTGSYMSRDSASIPTSAIISTILIAVYVYYTYIATKASIIKR